MSPLPVGTLGVGRRANMLFDWRARDGSLLARTGQQGVFTRASSASVIDANGVVGSAVHSQPRWIALDLDGDGVRETIAMLLERTGTNLCLQSENFATTWAANASVTRTAAAHTASGITLDLLSDASAVAAGNYSQTITFTGNAVKSVAVFVRKGSSTSSVIRLRDTIANADRLLGVLTWSGSVPSLAMTTGTYLGFDVCADGVYRLLFATTSVTAANTNSLQIYPATDSSLGNAGTGTLYAGGVQAENAPTCSSYIKTTTATVTRSAESLTFPFAVIPQALTVYPKFVEYGTADDSYVASIGTPTSSEALAITRDSAGGKYKHTHWGAATPTASTIALPSRGALVDGRLALNADGSLTAGTSVTAGAETTASDATVSALTASAFSAQTIRLGGAVGGAGEGLMALIALRIPTGAQSLTYAREL